MKTIGELDLTLVDLARRLGVAVSTVSLAVQRGSQLVDRKKLTTASVINKEK